MSHRTTNSDPTHQALALASALATSSPIQHPGHPCATSREQRTIDAPPCRCFATIITPVPNILAHYSIATARAACLLAHDTGCARHIPRKHPAPAGGDACGGPAHAGPAVGFGAERAGGSGGRSNDAALSWE